MDTLKQYKCMILDIDEDKIYKKIVNAPNPQALSLLLLQNEHLIKYKLKNSSKKFRVFNLIKIKRNQYLFLELLESLISSGIPLTKACHTLSQHGQVSSIAKNINLSISKGLKISVAMDIADFTEEVKSIVELCEYTGNLPQALKFAVEHCRLNQKNTAIIFTALIYPIIIILFILILSITIFLILPQFINQIPETISSFVSSASIQMRIIIFNIFSISLLFIPIIAKFFNKIYFIRTLINRIMLFLPVIGPYQKAECAIIYSFFIKEMLAASLPTKQTMQLSAKLFNKNLWCKERLMQSAKLIESGVSLNAAIDYRCFPYYVAAWLNILVTETSLHKVFDNIYRYSRLELDKFSKRIEETLPSIFILLLGIYILFFFFYIVYPIIGLSNMLLDI